MPSPPSRLLSSTDVDGRNDGPNDPGFIESQIMSNTDDAVSSVPSTDLRSARPQVKSYLGESGFMPIFDQASRDDSSTQMISTSVNREQSVPALPPLLQKTFAEAFMEFCYPWCPVLDREGLLDDEVFSHSLLLQHALALLGSTVNPPVHPHLSPRAYYAHFRQLFHGNHEHNPLVRIISIIMIYWWSAGPPNQISMESQYHYTSLAIRLSQEIGLHKEAASQVFRPGETRGLRRRIWWTLFVRVATTIPYAKAD